MVASPVQQVAALNQQVAGLYAQGLHQEALARALAALDIARRLPPQDAAQLAATLNNLAELRRVLGDADAAEALSREALDLTRRTAGEDSPEYATCLGNLALIHATTGRHADALPLAEHAHAIRVTVLEDGHPELEQGLRLLSLLSQELGDGHDAATYLTGAAVHARHRLGGAHPEVLTAFNEAGALFFDSGDHPAAEALFREAADGVEAAFGPGQELALAWENLATAIAAQRRHVEAAEGYRRALDLRRAGLGDEDPDTIRTLELLSQVAGTLATEPDDPAGTAAEPLLHEVAELHAAVSGADSAEYARSLNSLGAFYFTTGRLVEAGDHYERALAIVRRARGPEHRDVGWALHNLAALKQTLQEYGAAESLFGQALAIIRRTSDGDDPGVATALLNLAELYGATDRRAAAESLFREALDIRRRLFGADSPAVAGLQARLASLLPAGGDDREAVALLREAFETESAALGADHAQVAERRLQLARLLRSAGDREGAEALLMEEIERAGSDLHRLLAATKLLTAHHAGEGVLIVLWRRIVDGLRTAADADPLVLADALTRLAGVSDPVAGRDEVLALREEALELSLAYGGSEPMAAVSAMTALADFHRAEGNAAEALPLYRQAVQLCQGLGRPADAVPAAQAVVDIVRASPDAARRELSAALNNLGETRRQAEDPAAAVPLLEEALTLLDGAEDDDAALVLNNLGLTLSGLGRFAQARPFLERALAIFRAAPEPGPGLAFVLNNLSDSYARAGDHRSAEPLLRESVAVRREVFGEESAEHATALNNLGQLLLDRGDLAAAKPVLEAALATGLKTFGGDHPNVANTLGILAHLHRRLGNFTGAESMLRLTLINQRAALPPGDPAIAYTMGMLADVLGHLGHFGEAEQLHSQAGSMLAARFGDEHPEVATNLNNFGQLLTMIGKHAAAERCLRRALEVQRGIGDEVSTAIVLNNLAILMWDTGDPVEAVTLWREALRLRQDNLAPDSPDVAQSLNNLAVALTVLDPAEAEDLLVQALDIRRRVLGDEHPEVAETLNNLALARMRLGHPDEAEPILAESLRVHRLTRAADHPMLVQTLSNLCLLSARLGRADRALELVQEVAERQDQLVEKVFMLASERQRMAYIAPVQADLALALSVVLSLATAHPTAHPAARPAAVLMAFDLVLRRKAIVAEGAAAQRDALLGHRHPRLAPQFRELAALRAQSAGRMLAGPPYSEEERRLLSEWDIRRQDLEAELARQVPGAGLNERLRSAGRATIAAALPAGSALVEFVRVTPFDVVPDSPRSGHPPSGLRPADLEPSGLGPADLGLSDLRPARYLAFVLLDGAPDEVALLDLGPAEPIDDLIAFYRSVITHEPEIRPDALPPGIGAADAGYELRRRVFDPVREAAGDRRRLFLAPDGDLTRLPFEILPLGAERWVIDDFVLTYLSVGRDLARFAGPGSPSPASEPLVIADPDFDLGSDGEGPGLRFPPLAGTRAEGEHVASVLGVRPLLQAQALKATLKEVRAPAVLHIATHGFFLADSGPVPATSGGPAGDAVPANPLLRSGLALAGANAAPLPQPALPAEPADGLLTAEDVATMDLAGTRLVVLSACETGLGYVHVGEGVFGLRRAFMLAGAETLVMSLWKVPDRETRQVMEHFYDQVIRAGLGRAEALRAAQLAVRRHDSDPFAWGAFICQGDPGPLP